MKLRNHRLFWALFLLMSGAFLLLKIQHVFREFGDAIWGGMFALVGIGFLAWFLIDRQRNWRAIAGFPLVAIGALTLLAWRGVNLGDWQAPMILFGVALGFWAVLLSHDDHWWALIPAGVLTLMGVLMGLQARLSEGTWLAFFFLGLGAVFGLLYLLRLGQQDTGWAGIPTGAFLLMGMVTLVGASGLGGLFAQWWPALLVVAGVIMLVLALGGTRPSAPPPAPAPGPAEPVPGLLPSGTDRPAPTPTPTPTLPADEKPVDIYAVLSQQPQDDKKSG
jgi:hypothetical protein